MGSGYYLLLTLWAAVLPVYISSGSTPEIPVMSCKYDESTGLQLATCGSGRWPSDDELELLIPSTVKYLWLVNITFDNSSFGPIPFRPNLTRFNLVYLVYKAESGEPARFPLREFMVNVNRSVTDTLALQSVLLERLADGDFSDYSRLRELSLTNCDISEVHPRSFVGVGNGEHGGRLRLEISFDSRLTSFPWEALRPISAVLGELVLYANFELESVDFQPSNGKEEKPLVLAKLWFLYISSNPRLQTLSEAVMDTVDQYNHYVTFILNGNKCNSALNGLTILPLEAPMGSCELMPMIEWARAAPPFPDRNLRVTCAAVTNNKPVYLEKRGNGTFWRAHDEPNCVISTSSPPTSLATYTTTVPTNPAAITATMSVSESDTNATTVPTSPGHSEATTSLPLFTTTNTGDRMCGGCFTNVVMIFSFVSSLPVLFLT